MDDSLHKFYGIHLDVIGILKTASYSVDDFFATRAVGTLYRYFLSVIYGRALISHPKGGSWISNRFSA